MKIVIKAPKRAYQSTRDVYNSHQKAPKRTRKTKNYSLPQSEPNQSIKSTKDRDVFPISKLVQDNKLHKNENFSF